MSTITSGPFSVVGRERVPIRGTPKIDVRHIADGLASPRGASGVLCITGGRSGTYEVRRGVARMEHTLFGPSVVQALPIVTAPYGSPRERLACRCGEACVVLYARPGVGFVCRRCAERFCNSLAEAGRHRLMHERATLDLRLGMHIDRDGWISGRATKLSPEERAKLTAERGRVADALDRLDGAQSSLSRQEISVSEGPA